MYRLFCIPFAEGSSSLQGALCPDGNLSLEDGTEVANGLSVASDSTPSSKQGTTKFTLV